jgi:rhodanese-related sulfurtransferase
LPEREYGEEHLPGAINIPLKTLTAGEVFSARSFGPVIVYCHHDL